MAGGAELFSLNYIKESDIMVGTILGANLDKAEANQIFQYYKDEITKLNSRVLRAGASQQELRQLILEGIWYKPWGHGLAEGVIPLNRVMSEIGG